MARPRKPTKYLELVGAFRKDPQRRKDREGEPEVKAGLGKPPEFLDEAERARWNDIRKVAPWITAADRGITEQTCQLWALQRKGKATIGQSKLLQSNFVQLGLTPSCRSRVKVPGEKAKKKNAFGALSA